MSAPSLDRAVRTPLLFGLAVTSLLFGGLAAWATLAPLAEAAIAPGQIKVEGTRRTLQHLEGGVVREILVRDGDRVRAGQVVMRLDTVQAEASQEALRAQRFALAAQAARLAAEATDAAGPEFPAFLLAEAGARAAEALEGQRALFAARRAALQGQLLLAAAREEQQGAMLAAAEAQLATARRQLPLLRQEEEMRAGLVRQGLSRLPELLAVQRARTGIEGQVEEFEAQARRARAGIAEARAQARAMVEEHRQQAAAEAREVALRLAEAEERLRTATDFAERRDILAPEDGVVVNLRHFTRGGVVRPGEPVMELVPDSDRLVAELLLAPTDVDNVRPGLPAEIRLPGLRQRQVPYLEGRVTFVAADVTTDPNSRQSHFRAHVSLDPALLGALPTALTPGMPVEGLVRLGERSFWRYLTQPLSESFRRAFTEP